VEPKSLLRSTARSFASVAGLAAATYAGYAAFAWLRYGHHPEPTTDESDSLLDAFMPRYDVVERHSIEIGAPADVVLDAARHMDMRGSTITEAIFKARELVMGAVPEGPRKAHGIVEETTALGWRILAEVPGREVVVGAVTKPWEAGVKFIGVPAERFASFSNPEFVKIVWTLRADSLGPSRSVFRTETRAVATDAASRSKFRRYWAMASPGIWLIRRMSLGPLKCEVERSVRSAPAA
jgi:hypothetical protein